MTWLSLYIFALSLYNTAHAPHPELGKRLDGNRGYQTLDRPALVIAAENSPYIRLNGGDSALLMMLVGYNIGMVWTKSRVLFNGCYLVQCFLHHPMVRVLTGPFA